VNLRKTAVIVLLLALVLVLVWGCGQKGLWSEEEVRY